MSILNLEDPAPGQCFAGNTRIRTNALNQDGEVVQTSVGNLVVQRRLQAT